MIVHTFEIDENIMRVRDFKRVMRGLNYAVMAMWRTEILPQKFQVNAKTRTGGMWKYRSRSKNWNITKQRRFGHQKPNLATGAMMRAIKSNVMIRAFPDRATLRTRGTSEHRMWYQSKLEIEARTPREARDAARWQAREYARLANTDRFRRKRKKRSS